MTDPFTWQWRKLEAADEAVLQRLLEACSDFHLLTEGQMTPPTAARDVLNELPPGKDLADKATWGVTDTATGQLVGVLDAVLGFPEHDIAYLGLMLLHPDWRQRGWGPQLLAAVEQWAKEAGSRFLRLGVVEQNEGGHRFWKRHGFQEQVRRRQQFGRLESTVIVMQKPLN